MWILKEPNRNRVKWWLPGAGGWGKKRDVQGYKLATSRKISPRDLMHSRVNTDNNIIL